jgi:hypothetical protein
MPAIKRPVKETDAMTKRKIVQIATAARNDSEGDGSRFLYALCDDGSIWRMSDLRGWHQLPDIPQGTPKPSQTREAA